MFRAGQKPFRASRSPVEWCIVDLGSRAEVGKYKIARNDPKFCPVIDFWILRTLYAGGDSVFLLRLAGTSFRNSQWTLGRQLPTRDHSGQSDEAAILFFCFFFLLYVCLNCLGGHAGPEYVSGRSEAI